MKRKLLFGIAVFLLVLFGTGFSAMWLLDRTSTNYSRSNVKFFRETEALQSLRFETSTINTYYLPDMMTGQAPLPEIKSEEVFNNSYAGMKKALFLAQQLCSEEADTRTFERLTTSVDLYGDAYSKLFNEQPNTRLDRMAAVNDISGFSQQVSDQSNALLETLNIKLESNNAALRQETLRSNWLLGSLLAFGVVASILTYLQASRLLIDPITDLTDSVKEIRKGNFELSLPVRNSHDEVAQLIPAFNEMAAELRSMRRVTDAQFHEVDLLNRAILASFPYPIVLLDPQGQIDKLNPSAQDLLAETGSLSGLPSNVARKVNAAIETDTELLPEKLDEALLLRVEEEEHFYLPRMFKSSTPDGDFLGWILLLTDVTRLRFFDDMKSNLISTVSHEIKTPLTGIRMVLHLLLEKKIGPLTDTQEEMLNSAHGDCERLLKTLSNLLEMSRMDSGASSLDLRELDCTELLENSMSTFQQIAADKNITIKRNYHEGLPKVMGDELRLMEVVNNFISNALKHAPPSSTITLTTRERGSDFIRVKVADEGEGVPQESRPRIFERFYRAPDQSNVQGIGLGLSIAREIITAHEGRIGLLDGPNGETVFYFELPKNPQK